ncbi:hypothetical protein CDAR_456521 [Caerostris darwini]|uniref:Uncharacterized protein n=1 Tax=Caerostris darwini TaxID=1538125 RepID=A0AAV4VB33_9ARAC|nr:hypothetical protein CDAR_456521 [Caerostris darwini]
MGDVRFPRPFRSEIKLDVCGDTTEQQRQRGRWRPSTWAECDWCFVLSMLRKSLDRVLCGIYLRLHRALSEVKLDVCGDTTEQQRQRGRWRPSTWAACDW